VGGGWWVGEVGGSGFLVFGFWVGLVWEWPNWNCRWRSLMNLCRSGGDAAGRGIVILFSASSHVSYCSVRVRYIQDGAHGTGGG
jgi:hypothetical protein